MDDTTKVKQRTERQNKALHKYFSQLADALNEAGLDMRVVLKPEIAIPWSSLSVKDHLWRPIQTYQLSKKSTTELTTKDIDIIYDTLNLHLSEKFHLHIPFPSIDSLIDREEA